MPSDEELRLKASGPARAPVLDETCRCLGGARHPTALSYVVFMTWDKRYASFREGASLSGQTYVAPGRLPPLCPKA